MRSVAIHQPNYLPWLGYFYKIFATDHFILLDDVPYSKGSLTARTPRRKQQKQIDRSFLTVPVKKAGRGTLIKDLKIDHAQEWQERHLNYIAGMYRQTPFFETYFPLVENWMARSRDFAALASWNIFLIRHLCKLLELKTNWGCSGELTAAGNSTEYLVNLIKALHGDQYLSGTGGKKYLQAEKFTTAGIQLSYHDLYHFLEQYPYPQTQGPWLNGLSILDALMNIGVEGIVKIFKHYQRVQRSSFL